MYWLKAKLLIEWIISMGMRASVADVCTENREIRKEVKPCCGGQVFKGHFHGTSSPEITSDGTFVYMAYADEKETPDIPGFVESQGTKNEMFLKVVKVSQNHVATKPLSLCFLVTLQAYTTVTDPGS